jgi:hypothetical protein
MLSVVRTFLVLCTAVAAFGASSLHGKVLCFGDGGHAAVEPPHADTPCAATHESHEHERGQHEPVERRCSDVSADFLTARDGPVDSVNAAHFDAGLLPPPPDVQAYALIIWRVRLGVGTDPPPDGNRACLRSIILLI